MIIYDEPAEKYHAREAVSAGFLWKWISECPAQAYHESVFNRDQKAEAIAGTHFDVGTALHLAILESSNFAAKCSLIAFDDYRSKAARDLRDQCYIDGKVPLLPQDYDLVSNMRVALEMSPAADFLFGEGKNEVSYTWDIDGVPCKARADRITPQAIIDLKSAEKASPATFQRAMLRDGHHVRAAWYLDGFEFQPQYASDQMDYLFIVVAKTPPHLVEVYRVGERALAWGRTLIEKALREFRRARESGVYSGYSGESGRTITNMLLPAFAENQLIAQERAGVFDDQDDQDIPY